MGPAVFPDGNRTVEAVTSAKLCNKRSLVLEAGALTSGRSVHGNGCDHLIPCLVRTRFFTSKRHLLNHTIRTLLHGTVGARDLTSRVPAPPEATATPRALCQLASFHSRSLALTSAAPTLFYFHFKKKIKV